MKKECVSFQMSRGRSPSDKPNKTMSNYQTEITLCDTTLSTGTYWTIEEARTAAKNGQAAIKRANGWRIRNLTTGDIIESSR